MTPVSVPLWLFVVLVFLASVAVLERLILPPLRVVLRKRFRAVVEKLNQKLSLKLKPFKLAKKKALEQLLAHDPEVLRLAEKYRQEHNLSWREVEDLLAIYAREIVPTFSVYLYYRLGHAATKRVVRGLYKVRVGFLDRQAFSQVDPDDSVVFLMNHRSNLDYLLVAYLISRHAAISYAVGEWARVWPLDTLIRRLGGYFVRRDTSDPLYRKVLERFVQLATDAGLTQGVFPEGKLTRDGALQTPKLGLLSYLLKGFNPQGERDLVFVPVGINYDRVLEDRTHALGLPVSVAGARQMLAWAWRQAWNSVRGQGHRLGYAAVNFGKPISTRALLADVGDARALSQEAFRQLVSRVGEKLWQAVAATVSATPIPLFCRALLAQPLAEGVSVSTLYQALDAEAHRFRERGVLLPALETGELFHYAREVLVARGWVQEQVGQLFPVAEAVPLLRFYANSLAHYA